MWFKRIVGQHGDTWLWGLLPLSFLLLGISLGILYPTSAIEWRSSSRHLIIVPTWRQGWTPSNEPIATKSFVSEASNRNTGSRDTN